MHNVTHVMEQAPEGALGDAAALAMAASVAAETDGMIVPHSRVVVVPRTRVVHAELADRTAILDSSFHAPTATSRVSVSRTCLV